MLWFWLLACDVTLYANLPDAPSGTNFRDSAEPPAPEEIPPTTIARFDVSCPNPDTVRLEVETTGPTNGIALVYLIETTDPTPWDEEHPAFRVVHEAEAPRVIHRAELIDGANEASWRRGQATLWDCDGEIDPTVLTWVARVYDVDGNLADCVASGLDPQGVIRGDFHDIAAHRGPSELDEFEACRVALD